jgi:hypothetical protein
VANQVRAHEKVKLAFLLAPHVTLNHKARGELAPTPGRRSLWNRPKTKVDWLGSSKQVDAVTHIHIQQFVNKFNLAPARAGGERAGAHAFHFAPKIEP